MVSNTEVDVSDSPTTDFDSLDFFGGQAEGDGQADGDESEDDSLDLSEWGDRSVRVKVDGEELKVPLREAIDGYQRQADYTRKTQALSAQQQELQWASTLRAALENDPRGTLDLLSTHYKINGQAQTPPSAGPSAKDSEWGEWGDESSADAPVDAKYDQLNARISAFEQEKADQQLTAEVARLQNKYGDDFNPQEVVNLAFQRKTADLEGVYKQSAFERYHEQKLAAQQATEREAARVTAKETASVVSGGSSARGNDGDDGPVESIRDAWAAAKKELGIR